MNLIIIIIVVDVAFVVEAFVVIIGSAEKMRVFLVQFMKFFLLPFGRRSLTEFLRHSVPTSGTPSHLLGCSHSSADNRRIPYNHRQRSFPNGSLLIDVLDKRTDSGEYKCSARSGHKVAFKLVKVIIDSKWLLGSLFGRLAFVPLFTASIAWIAVPGAKS